MTEPDLLTYYIGQAIAWLPWIITGASVLRLALHWLRGFLQVWVSTGSQLWPFFDKLELSLAYVSISLAAFGKKAPSSTLSEPVTKAADASEGKIR